MRQSPDLPVDAVLDEWNRPKTIEGWEAYYEEGPSLQQQLAQFAAYLIYFARSDLCYISWDLLERPSPAICSSLRFLDKQLEGDAQAIGALWEIRNDLSVSRSARWEAQCRVLEMLCRLES